MPLLTSLFGRDVAESFVVASAALRFRAPPFGPSFAFAPPVAPPFLSFLSAPLDSTFGAAFLFGATSFFGFVVPVFPPPPPFDPPPLPSLST